MEQKIILFTTTQVAEIMSISRNKVYELLNKGALKSMRIGRSRRVSNTQIEDFINSISRKTTNE